MQQPLEVIAESETHVDHPPTVCGDSMARRIIENLFVAGYVIVPKEPTPKMIEAGAEVIWQSFGETMPWGSELDRGIAVEVFRAMRACSGR